MEAVAALRRLDQFGRALTRRAFQGVGAVLVARVEHLGEPEVDQFQLARLVHQDVRGFDVPVH